MSESCEVPNPLVIHPTTTPLSNFYAHVPATPSGEQVDSGADRGADADVDSDACTQVDAKSVSGSRSPLPARIDAETESTFEAQRSQYFTLKPIIDFAITGLLMVVAVPLMTAVGFAVLIFDGRPIFYRQIRLGKGGREFRIWKFRTMCHHAEGKTGAVWSNTSDPRVTPLGRWLRCSHLDELPQLVNVLVGEMSLIGPRPERPEFVHELSQELPFYRARLSVHPGITGLAQLHLGYDQSVADVQKKVLLDLKYIQTATFRQDAMILLRTIPYIVGKLVDKWRVDRTGIESDEGIVEPPVAARSESDQSAHIHRPQTCHPHKPNDGEAGTKAARFPHISIDAGASPTTAWKP